ncbi:MAG: DUF2235 domain-containing protein [Paracoccaceae bacterium]
MRLTDKIRGWLGLPKSVQTSTAPRVRGRVDHVVILDGTLSSLTPGSETNAGQAYRLLCGCPGTAQLSIRYEQGTQWRTWRDAIAVAEGRGINRQIRRAYGFIASRYRPGDRIFLLGYSRGAYAVRSLAGVIDRVGLLRSDNATERNIRQIYRHYQLSPDSMAAKAFAREHCHARVEIEMVGVWDTVKALGNRLPVMWRFADAAHEFHSAKLGDHIRHGYQALAMHETREAYEPILWVTSPDYHGVVEQVWFKGAHSDIGGQIEAFQAARPLANIPLVWMLEKLEGCDVKLPSGWQEQFEQDVSAPSIGTWRSWGKMFWFRRKRVVGADPSESVHISVSATKGG